MENYKVEKGHQRTLVSTIEFLHNGVVEASIVNDIATEIIEKLERTHDRPTNIDKVLENDNVKTGFDLISQYEDEINDLRQYIGEMRNKLVKISNYIE